MTTSAVHTRPVVFGEVAVNDATLPQPTTACGLLDHLRDRRCPDDVRLPSWTARSAA